MTVGRRLRKLAQTIEKADSINTPVNGTRSSHQLRQDGISGVNIAHLLHCETFQHRILAGGDIAEELVLHALQQLRRACGELVEVLVVLVQVTSHSEVLHLGDVRSKLEQLGQIEFFNHVPVAADRQGRHAILLAVHAAVVVTTRSLFIVVRLDRRATSASVAVVRVGGRSVSVLLCVGALLLSLSSVAGCS